MIDLASGVDSAVGAGAGAMTFMALIKILAAKLHLPPGTRFWIGAIDEEMTAQAYIVPGLGDAGGGCCVGERQVGQIEPIEHSMSSVKCCTATLL